MRAMPAMVMSIAILLNACTSAPEVHTVAAASADLASPTPVDTKAEGTGDPDRLICQVTRTIGSNLSHKVCRTAAQIERDREAGREALSKQQKGH